MHKITRTLTVIGSAVALTLAGTGVASATSYPAPGGIGDISSHLFPGGIPGAPVNAEQELHRAAEGYAQRSTGKNVALRNTEARTTNITGTWSDVASGVERIIRTTGHPHWDEHVFFRVNRNNHGPLIAWLNNNSRWNHDKEYGVHVHSDATYYYVNIAFFH
ncbi:hypothetical protein NYP18_09640 [Corynebacterium sp. YIM 101645]|uniref:Secreted protein n=1 Tax=Corynebacterium lemuris TaxID=1859292 RepID=A0ABT2G0V4_9CORY|nr:hypothetical protein [Corynebacterium lemuris]MCS5479917.1 hypothetical protein [Corynebacterium lemuris]